MDPLISVIIPVFNMENWLSRCLDSVLRNTYRQLELLCVDDGSSDASAEILRAYAEKDSRVVPIFKENGGVSSARNAGLNRMTGEYVCFVDPDDYVHPQYFELLYRAVEETGAEISICSYSSIDINDLVQAELMSLNPQELQNYSISEVFRQHDLRSYCWGKLIRSELVANVRFHEDLHYVEDTVFFSEVCENTSSAISFLPSRLYYYCQREGSLTKSIRPPQHLMAAKHLVQNLLRSEDHDNIYLEQTFKRCLNTRYMATHIFPDRKVTFECRALLRSLRKRLWKTSAVNWTKKTILYCFSLFPFLYWLFRSIKEPYMWKWEQVERRKRRAQKKRSFKSVSSEIDDKG